MQGGSTLLSAELRGSAAASAPGPSGGAGGSGAAAVAALDEWDAAGAYSLPLLLLSISRCADESEGVAGPSNDDRCRYRPDLLPPSAAAAGPSAAPVALAAFGAPAGTSGGEAGAAADAPAVDPWEGSDDGAGDGADQSHRVCRRNQAYNSGLA